MMEHKISFRVFEDNQWQRVEKKFGIFNKRKRGKKNKSNKVFTISMFIKAHPRSLEIVDAQLEKCK